MKFNVLTLFPDIIYNYCDEAIIGRAQKNDLIRVSAHNFRQFSGNKWGHVDDRPYGGGPGMILRVEPIYECLKNIQALKAGKAGKAQKVLKIENSKLKIIALDPAGKKFDQRMAEKFAQLDELVLVCGRYEGFDARVYDLVDERVSVGDFVLAGGELAALSIIEATSRLIPGVLGNSESLVNETHNESQQIAVNSKQELKIENLKLKISKEYPQYTKPVDFMGKKVPKVLFSGNHKKIEEWRKKNSK
jgi:tRNA (guanine37-N1)-methyltransferase